MSTATKNPINIGNFSKFSTFAAVFSSSVMLGKNWLPVIGLTFAAFIFNTSEFIPIGLLSDIAADLQVSEAKAGLLITIYAWMVAVTSLPLMLAVSRMEYRKILISILALFFASHVLSALSVNYTMLMISRIGVACSHAIFWSIVSPLAVKVAPDGHKSTALSLIVTGTSVAMIIGLPLGRAIGIAVGWRATFMCIAAVTLAVLSVISFVFPKVDSDGAVTLKDLPGLFRNRALIGIYILTVILISAHFTGYSYIEPFLAQTAGFKAGSITVLLTVFGLVGIIGSILFSRFYDREPGIFIKYGVGGITAFLLLLRPAAFSPCTMVIVCILWGLAITCYNLAFQSEIIRVAPKGTAIAMSVYSGIYNVGIGSGALIGGTICTHLSIGMIGYIGGAIASIAFVFCICWLLPILLKRN